MDFVNIVYRYVNRFINSDKLVELLENIDKSKFSKKEIKELNKLLNEIKSIIKDVPIEIDEVEIKRLRSIDHLLDNLKKIMDNEKNSQDARNFAKENYEKFLAAKDKSRDSGLRYNKIYNILTNSSLHLNYCEKMSDLELLNFIAQYISVPCPPNIDQETFDDLVKVGIKEDKREALWRLAFNYNMRKMNFTLIENYFIDKRDDYYLLELISAVKEDLDMDKLIKKVVETKDKKFIINCANRSKKLGIFSLEELRKLKEKYKDFLNF